MDDYLGNSRSDNGWNKRATRPAQRPARARSIRASIALIAGLVLVLGVIGLIAQTIATGGSFPLAGLRAVRESLTFTSVGTKMGGPSSGNAPSSIDALPGTPDDGAEIRYSPPIDERMAKDIASKDGKSFRDDRPSYDGQPKGIAPTDKASAKGFMAKKGRDDFQSTDKPHADKPEPMKKDGYFSPAKPDRTEPPVDAKDASKEERPTKLDGLKSKETVAGGQEPEDMNRKIIRIGEMDFEVDSYEVAVLNITRLIVQIKGAFVSDTKSAQLASGKLHGYVIVRMPPQFLDQFLLDVRRELGKIGELKAQRINSQDVTKQYTDIESALKAARTMEERILSIIKTGKGEIKDLITAENALGEWRTKIEKLEGEMRYYSNQVSLSTMTISLSERALQTPFALVATENVSMRIEAEDVKKAHQTAEKAAIDAKGRVLRSEVKQHAAGQLEAILQVEIPPSAKDAFGALLESLGIVSHQESHRQQEAKGGTGKVTEALKPAEAIKPKEHDTHFEVTFNNLVNIESRNSTTLQIATEDVAGGYAKLHEAIARVKGQVRNTHLNETDKKNVNASIEFSVPTAQKQAIDKAIADVGPLLTRNNVQAPITQLASERKFGYNLTLVHVANIQPREKIQLKFEVKDVDESAAKLKDLAAAAKGRVTDARTQRRPNGDVAAILAFDVPLAAKDSLVRQFKDTGKLIGQEEERFPQAPENDLAVAHIHVILAGESPIVPSDENFGAYLRTGFYTSFKIFAWCVMVIIIGVSAVLPWTLLIWGGYKLYCRMSPPPVARAEPVLAHSIQPPPPASTSAAEEERTAL